MIRAAAAGFRHERRTSPARSGAKTGSRPSVSRELEHGGLAARGDVAVAVGVAVAGRDEGVHDVADVDEVARLAARRRRRWRCRRRPRGRSRWRHAGLAARVLARAVDVGEPQAEGREPVQPPVEAHVALRRGLGRRVGRQRARLGVLRRGHDLGVAVDRAAGGGEHDAPHAGLAGRLEQRGRADDVDRRVERGVLDRAPDVDLGREVVDHLGARGLEGRGDRAGVGDAAFVQRRARRPARRRGSHDDPSRGRRGWPPRRRWRAGRRRDSSR